MMRKTIDQKRTMVPRLIRSARRSSKGLDRPTAYYCSHMVARKELLMKNVKVKKVLSPILQIDYIIG